MKHNKCLIQWPGRVRSVNVRLREVAKQTPSVFNFCTNEFSGRGVQVVVSSPSSTSLTQHQPKKTPMCNTREEMSSSQVNFYVHIIEKSKRGNIFCSLKPDVLHANTRKNYWKATSWDILMELHYANRGFQINRK